MLCTHISYLSRDDLTDLFFKRGQESSSFMYHSELRPHSDGHIFCWWPLDLCKVSASKVETQVRWRFGEVHKSVQLPGKWTHSRGYLYICQCHCLAEEKRTPWHPHQLYLTNLLRFIIGDRTEVYLFHWCNENEIGDMFLLLEIEEEIGDGESMGILGQGCMIIYQFVNQRWPVMTNLPYNTELILILTTNLN